MTPSTPAGLPEAAMGSRIAFEFGVRGMNASGRGSILSPISVDVGDGHVGASICGGGGGDETVMLMSSRPLSGLVSRKTLFVWLF